MMHEGRSFGPYQLLQKIADGGMAEIYLARLSGIGGFAKKLVLKMIHPRWSSDENFITMLVEEAKLAVQLNHTSIAQVFDLGKHEGTYYIAMEYVDGKDAFAMLVRSGELNTYLPFEVTAYIVQQVAGALYYAHTLRGSDGKALNLIHRDVSPQNIIVSFSGDVKLIDFGIAKAEARDTNTQTGVIKGKFYYMSPEQAWGKPLTHLTDQFSLGICLHEMLTGQMIYNEKDTFVLLDKVRNARVPKPTAMRPEVPAELEAIVMRALAREPERRFESCYAFQRALTDYLHRNHSGFTPARVSRLMWDMFSEAAPDKREADGMLARTDFAAARPPDSVIFNLDAMLAEEEDAVLGPGEATRAAPLDFGGLGSAATPPGGVAALSARGQEASVGAGLGAPSRLPLGPESRRMGSVGRFRRGSGEPVVGEGRFEHPPPPVSGPLKPAAQDIDAPLFGGGAFDGADDATRDVDFQALLQENPEAARLLRPDAAPAAFAGASGEGREEGVETSAPPMRIAAGRVPEPPPSRRRAAGPLPEPPLSRARPPRAGGASLDGMLDSSPTLVASPLASAMLPALAGDEGPDGPAFVAGLFGGGEGGDDATATYESASLQSLHVLSALPEEALSVYGSPARAPAAVDGAAVRAPTALESQGAGSSPSVVVEGEEDAPAAPASSAAAAEGAAGGGGVAAERPRGRAIPKPLLGAGIGLVVVFGLIMAVAALLSDPKGQLTISSSPDKAEVVIDGSVVGMTPTTIRDLAREDGALLEVTLRKEGYQDAKVLLTWDEGVDQLTHHHELRKQ